MLKRSVSVGGGMGAVAGDGAAGVLEGRGGRVGGCTFFGGNTGLVPIIKIY